MFFSLMQPFEAQRYAAELRQALDEARIQHMREAGLRMAQNRIELAKSGQLYI